MALVHDAVSRIAEEIEAELFLNGSAARLVPAPDQTLTFEGLVAARSDFGDSAGYRIVGVIENVGGTTSFVGTPTVEELGEDEDWTVEVLADDANDALVIRVTGDATDETRWVATVQTAQVAFAPPLP